MWEPLLADSLRFFSLIMAGVVVIGGSTVGIRYARIAVSAGGVKQMWKDLMTLNLNALLPIHVAIVSFVMVAYAIGNSIEVGERFGEPPTWRLIYFPLNFLGAFTILLVSLFVRNKGARVEPVDETLTDRAESESAEFSDFVDRVDARKKELNDEGAD